VPDALSKSALSGAKPIRSARSPLEADQQLNPERLPGEGQACTNSPTGTCLEPLVCVNDLCESPYQ